MIISNHYERELNVLHQIITNHPTTLAILSDEMSIPKLTIKGDILKLNAYFLECTNNKNDLIVSSNQGFITINSMFVDNAITYFYQLKLFLSNNSSLFRLCVLFLTNYSISKQQIIDNLFISETYLFKLCSQLNDCIAPFNLSVHSSNQIFKLEGDEICLRLFSYIVLQDFFQGIEWPFDSETPKINFDNSESSVSLTKNHAFYLLSEITKQRFSNSKYLIIKPNSSLYSLMKLIQDNYDVSETLKKNFFVSLPQNIAKSEKIYFNFFTRIFLSDLIPSEAKLRLGRKFEYFNHPVCLFSNEIYSRFSNVSCDSADSTEKEIYLYYLTIFNVLYSIIGDKYRLFLDLMLPIPYLNITKNDDYMNIIKTEIHLLFEDKELEKYIAGLLYTISSSKKETTLKLYIQMSKVFTNVYIIEKRIRAVFNSKNIIFTNDFSQADIIITDSLEKQSEHQILFYLDSVNNSSRWLDLMTLIQKKFFEKIGDN